MDAVGHLLETWGYALLVLIGFVEFIGLPIASVPVLILGGAVAASGGLSLPLVALSAAAGGLAADLTWYWVTRWRGPRLVDTVCNLTSNPRVCVYTVTQRIERIGPMYILPSKFLPGTGNLIAASSGLAGIAPRAFFAADSIALLLWGVAYASLGYLFSAEVSGVVEEIAGFASIAAAVAVLLVLSATGWRVVRARSHAAGHAEAAEAGVLTKAGAHEPAAASAAKTDRSEILHDVTAPVHDSTTIRPRTA
jgi:membrane protein DedA with SNARE-associated domain